MTALAEFELDPARTALLVVDFQNDFVKEEGFFAGAGHDVAPCQAAVDRTRQLLDEVRPHGIPVYFSRSISRKPEFRLPPLRFRASQGSDGFKPGEGGKKVFAADSWGAQIVDELPPQPDDVVIDKQRYDFFFDTSLEEQLREHGIDTIVVTGATTNCCVDSTARSGFMRGFAVLVLSDCVAGFGNEDDLNAGALRNLELFFGVVATADEYVDDLRTRATVAP
jgi:nicotinamidase-related amidase